MQAIEVKFIPATNTHCLRVKAVWACGVINSVTVAYDHEHSERDNAANAAMKLVRKLDLVAGVDTWLCAETRGGYVFLPSNSDQFGRHAGFGDD